MTQRVSKSPKVGTLNAADLEQMITRIVRRVLREEKRRDYYIDANGIKVLYDEEDIDPDYLKELNDQMELIEHGDQHRVSAEEVKSKLRKSGVKV